MNKQKKPVHALSLPYPDPEWPAITPDQEQAILSLLLPLLQPIGAFKQDNVPRSKGQGRAGKTQTKGNETIPELYEHLTIGFNSTVRRLEGLARGQKPEVFPAVTTLPPPPDQISNLSLVLVCRRNLPDIMTSSLPLLVATSAPLANRARLIEVSPQAESKVAQALQQPRVGVLGVEAGAPGTETLSRFVTDTIPTVEVPWLDRPHNPTYFPVKVKTTNG
ncbi:RNase P and RNase MRP subunit [Exophiala dermatitidis]|uniref:Uncharacterized protein n=2 Tax=Exophiala dermatitidis TaxID=5970 RepID=H6C1S0_EXODN